MRESAKAAHESRQLTNGMITESNHMTTLVKGGDSRERPAAIITINGGGVDASSFKLITVLRSV
jgi:hypothetical protein